MVLYFIRGVLLGGAAASQPGPLQAFLLNRSLKNGWRRTLPAAFAPLLSDAPIIILVVLILTRTPVWMLTALRIFGGAYLLYLAREAFLGAKTAADTSSSQAHRESPLRMTLQAAMMNVLNPNPYMFWGAAAGPILADAWSSSPGTGGSFLIGFYGALIGGFMLFTVLVALAGRLNRKVTYYLGISSAAVMAGFAVLLPIQGIVQLQV